MTTAKMFALTAAIHIVGAYLVGDAPSALPAFWLGLAQGAVLFGYLLPDHEAEREGEYRQMREEQEHLFGANAGEVSIDPDQGEAER